LKKIFFFFKKKGGKDSLKRFKERAKDFDEEQGKKVKKKVKRK